MKRILLILLSINLFAFAFGQSITVKGKVSSTDGELLPGVNVKVKDAKIKVKCWNSLILVLRNLL